MELPHMVSLTDRRELTVTGVEEVVTFEEATAELNTRMGTLLVHGSGLRLKHLDPDSGRLSLTGEVTALVYQPPKASGGWLSRILK